MVWSSSALHAMINFTNIQVFVISLTCLSIREAMANWTDSISNAKINQNAEYRSIITFLLPNCNM